MNDSEAARFIEEMLVAFPDLEETARFNSPDLAATHRSWGKVLSACAYAECRKVLDDWLAGVGPDRADAKRPAHAVRAVVMLRRDKAAKVADKDRRVAEYQSRQYQQLPNTPYTDSGMCSVFTRWRPVHAAWKAGEISEEQYQQQRAAFLQELTPCLNT